ncbi:hypothetical protein [Streptomyces mirabilis]|uniref:hypothetical protein n=1 Tax=Streptomyces mirabilis TaxID=68239 RepID=UPI003333297E
MSCLRCPARTKAPCSGARKASAAGAERSPVRWTTEIVRRGSPGPGNRGPAGATAVPAAISVTTALSGRLAGGSRDQPPARALRLLGGACVLRTRRTDAGRGPGDRSETEPMSSGTCPLRQGCVTHALDPKAPITFLSLLPRFVPAGGQAMSALTALGRVLLSEPSLR